MLQERIGISDLEKAITAQVSLETLLRKL